MLTSQIAVFFLVFGTATAWSQRLTKPTSRSAGTKLEPALEHTAESKVSQHFAKPLKPSSRHLILHDDDHFDPEDQHGSKDAQEYVDSEESKSHKEKEEHEDHHNADKTTDDQVKKDVVEKETFQEFEKEGTSFDKHHKDKKVDNKELENVKQHDVNQKFGAEALKEHKLGKHKEKSKGHKTHGFKNVYHKEEYGDHKTFHDEFLDNDHQHEYDDQHEHSEAQGGKFSKGYKHEGRNKKLDKGDEKHEWRKAGYDGHHEGNHEKNVHASRHHHGRKKHEGHHQANAENGRYSLRQRKKGEVPHFSSHAVHHGPHQAQIQHYDSRRNPHTHHHAPIPKHHHRQTYDDDEETHQDHGAHDSHHSSEEDPRSSHQQRNAHYQKERKPHRDPIEDHIEDRIAQKPEPVEYKKPSISNYEATSQPLLQKKEYAHLKEPEYERRHSSPLYGDKFRNWRVYDEEEQKIRPYGNQDHVLNHHRFRPHHSHGAHKKHNPHLPVALDQASLRSTSPPSPDLFSERDDYRSSRLRNFPRYI